MTIHQHIMNMKMQPHDMAANYVVSREKWGTETEMVTLTLLYGIRINSINKTPFQEQFSYVDSVTNARYAATNANVFNIDESLPMLNSVLPTINLFFHVNGDPMNPAKEDKLDHFCLLHPQEKATINPGRPPYCGCPEMWMGITQPPNLNT